MDLCPYCGKPVPKGSDDRKELQNCEVVVHGTCWKIMLDNTKNRYYEQDRVR